MFDDTYEQIAAVTTGREGGPDYADFYDARLLISYYLTPKDLSPVGGPTEGWAFDGRFQKTAPDDGMGT